MEEIQILDKTFTSFISSEEIDHSIQRMTNTLYEEYKHTVPVFIGVLNGVIMFFSDFLKNYKGNCEIGFLQLSSYKGGLKSSGNVDLITDMTVDITDRDVIILEDPRMSI